MRFLKFKGAEVASKQDELRELLNNMPDDVIQAGHDYGPSQDAQPVPSTTLKSDNETRWNSKVYYAALGVHQSGSDPKFTHQT